MQRRQEIEQRIHAIGARWRALRPGAGSRIKRSCRGHPRSFRPHGRAGAFPSLEGLGVVTLPEYQRHGGADQIGWRARCGESCNDAPPGSESPRTRIGTGGALSPSSPKSTGRGLSPQSPHRERMPRCVRCSRPVIQTSGCLPRLGAWRSFGDSWFRPFAHQRPCRDACFCRIRERHARGIVVEFSQARYNRSLTFASRPGYGFRAVRRIGGETLRVSPEPGTGCDAGCRR